MSHCGVAWVGELLGERNARSERGRACGYPARRLFPLDETDLESMTRLSGTLSSWCDTHGYAADRTLARFSGLAA
jgi:hypothetical protein